VGYGAGVNLRGLGSDATLVLVNGHRLSPTGAGNFVDISQIPVGAIDRIDVVTDGSSAIYGSDAVGGVVNIRLRNDFDGAETRLQYGSMADGGPDEYGVEQTFRSEERPYFANEFAQHLTKKTAILPQADVGRFTRILTPGK
jgi:outer membrane cobalamin receptor